MALPPTVRVKLSSEAAESISLTPVVVQDLAIRELMENILAVVGKDEARIREVLRRGSLVNAGSRFRWTGWDADAGSLRDLLATFPGPDPSIRFDAARCVRAVLRGDRRTIQIPREAAERKGMFQRTTYWGRLMEAVGRDASYNGYSYRDRADVFVRVFTSGETAKLREAAPELRYTSLRDQVRSIPFDSAELYVPRG